MDLDEILQEIGEFGLYQKLVIGFILLPAVFPCGFHAYNQLFMSSEMDHWCRVPGYENLKNISIPQETQHDNVKYSQCYMYDTNYSSNFNETNPTIKCRYGWIYNDSLNQKSVINEWDLVCDKKIFPTLALVAFGISGLIGNYVFGYIQDGCGRKPAFFIYLIIQCFFGIVTVFAKNFFIWTLLRIGVGFTVPAILGTPLVLAIELVGPRYRTWVTILSNISYSISLTTLAAIVWAVRDWRTLSLVTSVPFLGLFLFYCFLPESPRWLLAKGNVKEAEKILNKMARINNTRLPKVYLHQLQRKSKTNSKKPTENYGIKHLFKTPNLRKKTIIITFIWFTNTTVYVGLSYYAPALGGNEYFNFFLAGIAEFPTYIFLWPATEKCGRRWTLCVSMIVGGSACLASFLVKNDMVLTLILYCIGKMGISCSFVVLPLIASELYPTVVRGLGISFSSVIGMLGPVLIPLVNYLGTEMLTLPLIIMGGLLIAGGGCSLLLPETLNQHLPQTLEDGEMQGLKNFKTLVPTTATAKSSV